MGNRNLTLPVKIITGLSLGFIFVINTILTVQSLPDDNINESGQIQDQNDPSTVIKEQNEASGKDNFDFFLYFPQISRCHILYFDDFSDSNSGWPITPPPNFLFWNVYQNGHYLMGLSSDYRWGYHWVNYPGTSVSDYLVSVDARKLGGTGGTWGINFSETGGVQYLFLINSNEWYSIWIHDSNPFPNEWTLLESGFSSNLNPGNASNIIAIERTNVQIRAYANGELISAIEDDSLTGPGNLGLYVNSGAYNYLEVEFDNFKVEPSGCGWSQVSNPNE